MGEAVPLGRPDPHRLHRPKTVPEVRIIISCVVDPDPVGSVTFDRRLQVTIDPDFYHELWHKRPLI